MTGLEKVNQITEELCNNLRVTHEDKKVIHKIIKSHILEVSQRCSFSLNAIPKEEKEQSEFRKYAKGAALNKLSVEGLWDFVATETREESTPLGPEEAITYTVLVVKP